MIVQLYFPINLIQDDFVNLRKLGGIVLRTKVVQGKENGYNQTAGLLLSFCPLQPANSSQCDTTTLIQ